MFTRTSPRHYCIIFATYFVVNNVIGLLMLQVCQYTQTNPLFPFSYTR
jgi:hypothetical protein